MSSPTFKIKNCLICKVIKKKKVDAVGEKSFFEIDVIKYLQLGTFESFFKELILHIRAKGRITNTSFR